MDIHKLSCTNEAISCFYLLTPRNLELLLTVVAAAPEIWSFCCCWLWLSSQPSEVTAGSLRLLLTHLADWTSPSTTTKARRLPWVSSCFTIIISISCFLLFSFFLSFFLSFVFLFSLVTWPEQSWWCVYIYKKSLDFGLYYFLFQLTTIFKLKQFKRCLLRRLRQIDKVHTNFRCPYNVFLPEDPPVPF